MLETFNDYLSLLAIVCMVFFSGHLLLKSFVKLQKGSNLQQIIYHLIHYFENEEE